MSALYNELDPYAAQWIRNLVAANLVAPGVVDGRSIKELTASDVVGSGQRHFFAGIAVWSLALRMAGVPDDASVWTGSCPCQPFSAAGAGKGIDDERHLWPEWFRLIRESRPAVVFGEQVASPDGLSWLDAVRADLEGEGYAFGAADLCAAGVGAPHIRQRLFFGARLADSNVGPGEQGRALDGGRHSRGDAESRAGLSGGRGANCDCGHEPLDHYGESDDCIECSCVRFTPVGMGDAYDERPQGHGRPLGFNDEAGRAAPQRHSPSAGVWSNVTWLDCLDGKNRPTQPGLEPLVDGASSRVGRLRAYGNAIVPQVAATFIRAFLEPQ